MNTTDQMGVKPQNYMTLSIISTILGCCSFWGIGFIAGIIAVYFASQVNSRYEAGDLIGAEKNAKNARILAFVAIGLTILNFVISAVMYTMYPEIIQEQMEQFEILREQMENVE